MQHYIRLDTILDKQNGYTINNIKVLFILYRRGQLFVSFPYLSLTISLYTLYALISTPNNHCPLLLFRFSDDFPLLLLHSSCSTISSLFLFTTYIQIVSIRSFLFPSYVHVTLKLTLPHSPLILIKPSNATCILVFFSSYLTPNTWIQTSLLTSRRFYKNLFFTFISTFLYHIALLSLLRDALSSHI